MSYALPALIAVAEYTPAEQERYAGNPLVEALGCIPSDADLTKALSFLPVFDSAWQSRDKHLRLSELLQLQNRMIPLSSHIQLAYVVNTMMREGYVGRRPHSAEHQAVYQAIHDDQSKAKKAFQQSHDTLSPQLSTALLGVSGMGKTSTVKRVLARIPQVIYHPDIDVYQIPWLHFEMPSDGKGVKSLLTSIIEAISELIPDNTYVEDYIRHSKESVSSMQSSVRRLLNKHCVGLLIPDEIQNVANSKKDDQIVMTELTTLCNKSRVPVLFIGTPKAERILGLDFRQARRTVGLGLGNWGPLPRFEAEEVDGESQEVDSEWVDLMHSLWTYMYVRSPVRLTEGLLDTFYDCTQGIIDLAIKLLIVCQARAIHDGSETISEQLVRSVYIDQFRLVHPMVDALRDGDVRALARFQDIEPLRADDLLNDLNRRFRRPQNRVATTRPGDLDYVDIVANAAVAATGMARDDAEHYARKVEQESSARTVADAAAQVSRLSKEPVRVVAKGSKTAPKLVYRGLDARQDDLRNAIVEASRHETTIAAQLDRMGVLVDPWEATVGQ